MIDRLALVMPAFNESEGLLGFIDEVAEALRPLTRDLVVIVVDDLSTDGMLNGSADFAERPYLRRVINEVNRGHGPSALRAYAEGLSAGADVIVHVDGDGQFRGADIARVVEAGELAAVVHGNRRGRTDPWFRRVLTGAVQLAVWVSTGARVPDVNTPLRLYRSTVLRDLLRLVPPEAVVPHVHLSILERRQRLQVAQVAVVSLPRRGSDPSGTMWGPQKRPIFPPRRLQQFVKGAALEVWTWQLSPSARRRRSSRAVR